MKETSKRIILAAAVAITACTAATAQERTTADTDGHTERELWIGDGPRRIYGIMATPKDAGARTPVAIIAHGFNGTHSFGRTYFSTLCRLGWSCYAFDFPCGSVKSRSDSNTMNMSMGDEADDLRAIVRHLRSLPTTDTTAIALIGESQGGLASALAAAALGDTVSRMVLIYPALCIPDNWNAAYKTEADIPDTTRVWGVPLGRRFFSEVRAIDVYATIGRYGGPVLIVHGDSDDVVPPDYSRRAEAAYPDARLHIIRGARHGFGGRAREEAHRLVAGFLSAGAGGNRASTASENDKTRTSIKQTDE